MAKRVKIGSKNKAKVDAVVEIFADYPHLADATIESIEVASDVADQPKSLEETVRGARNRAERAFADCDYAIGIESGLNEVPYTKSGYMDVCCVSIYDGTEHHLGFSSMFEFPDTEIMRMILEDGITMTALIHIDE